MSQLALAIPEPIPGDPETVVTALETAAVFGAKGDAKEALRWVRHAATSAGETGRDARALDLARAASELGAAPAPRPSAPAPRSPSSRPLPTPPPRPVSMKPPPLSATPSPPRTSRPPPPSESPRERAFALRPSQPPPSRELAPKEPASKDPPASERRISLPPPARVSRNAARVSVAPSSEPGSYVVRPLTDGATLPGRAVEAFLVFVDPRTDLESLERAIRR